VLTLYLAALILGLGTFAVQLFASGDAQHDGPQLGSGAQGGSGAFGAAAPLDAHAQTALAPGTSPGHAGGGWGGIFLSLRFYMFAAIGFGTVGAPVTAFGSNAPALTLVVALATGFGVGCLAAIGFRALGGNTLSSSASPDDLVGQVGRVLVACGESQMGKVRVTLRGQIIDLVATTDEPRIEPGEGVIVQEVRPGSVHVCAAPSELLPG